MTNRLTREMAMSECVRDCIYATEGVCRLKNNPVQKKPQCPYREGTLTAISLL